MLKSMVRKTCLAAAGLSLLLGLFIPVKAAETEGAMTLQQTVKAAEIKESPEDGAATLREIEEGTAVIVYGDPQDSWSRVEYDGTSGYMESGALEFYMTDDAAEELEEEFETVQSETVRTVEEIELRQKSKRSSVIWGGIIAVLVAAIFIVGVVSAIRKDNGEEETEQGEKEEET